MTSRSALGRAPAGPAAAGPPPDAAAPLAEQARAAVGLLERFGDQLVVALDAVAAGDTRAVVAALVERERLLVQLAPVLAPLAAVRAHATAEQAATLAAVDAALADARHLHQRLTDQVAAGHERDPASGPGRPARLALVR